MICCNIGDSISHGASDQIDSSFIPLCVRSAMARSIGKRRERDLRAQILQGLHLETEKRLDEAERIYAGILETDSTNFYALYRLPPFLSRPGGGRRGVA